MKVLVAGSTGYLGRFVVQEFKRRGHWIRALARNPERLAEPGPFLAPAVRDQIDDLFPDVNQSLLSDDVQLVNPRDVAVALDGTVHVSDSGAASGTVFSIDPTTGVATSLTSPLGGTGSALGLAATRRGLADGDIVVANTGNFASQGAIVRIDPATGELRDGFEGDGPLILAVDNLPAELPADATRDFGRALGPLLPGLLAADRSAALEGSGLGPELRRATIVWRGKLTPDYAYLHAHL